MEVFKAWVPWVLIVVFWAFLFYRFRHRLGRRVRAIARGMGLG